MWIFTEDFLLPRRITVSELATEVGQGIPGFGTNTLAKKSDCNLTRLCINMMTEPEKLRDSQDYVTRELHKYGKMNGMTWNQEPLDSAFGIFRLAVFRAGEMSFFTFSKSELLEDYGSRQWEKELRSHIGEILMELGDE